MYSSKEIQGMLDTMHSAYDPFTLQALKEYQALLEVIELAEKSDLPNWRRIAGTLLANARAKAPRPRRPSLAWPPKYTKPKSWAKQTYREIRGARHAG